MMEDIEFHFVELKKLKASISEMEDPLSQWTEFIRHSEELSEADMKTLEKKRPILKKAHKALNEISMDSKTRVAYDRRKSVLFFYEKTLEKKFDDGKLEGKLEGAREKALETARVMLKEGDTIDKIARVTGLSIEEIKKLI
jgi:predicted transposase/invertase (TIGR01784 family)